LEALLQGGQTTAQQVNNKLATGSLVGGALSWQQWYQVNYFLIYLRAEENFRKN